jgi:hypothetical protein
VVSIPNTGEKKKKSTGFQATRNRCPEVKRFFLIGVQEKSELYRSSGESTVQNLVTEFTM